MYIGKEIILVGINISFKHKELEFEWLEKRL